MRAATRFHRDDARRELRTKRDDGFAAHAPAHRNLAVRIQTNDAAAVLAEIDSKHRDFHGAAPFD
jgi:hypothetical protein